MLQGATTIYWTTVVLQEMKARERMSNKKMTREEGEFKEEVFSANLVFI